MMRASRPVRSSRRSPRLGGAPRTSSLISSSRTRSVATFEKTSSAAGIARRVPGSSASRSVLANRTARSGRNPSSRKRASASPTARRRQRRRSSAPEKGSRSTPAIGSQAMAFTVKSRRARSPSMSPRNVTALGRRPSRYGPSPRNVVTSTLCSPVTTVTVPCCIPVGTTRGKSFTTCSGSASVATSKSWATFPSSRSRTAPPASQACLPAPRKARSKAMTSAGTALASSTPVSYHALNGAPNRTRTCGLRFRKPPLYPPELWAPGARSADCNATLPGRVTSEDDQRLDRAGARDPLAPFEEGELDHEEERAHLALLLLHQLRRAPGGPTGGEKVVDDRHLLARVHRIDVRLEGPLPVLERVLDAVGLVGQLPQLADGRQSYLESVGQRPSEEEASGLDGEDALESAAAETLLHGVEHRLQRSRIAEHRRDVLEHDAGLGKIGDFADQGSRLGERGHDCILAKNRPPVPWGGWDRRPRDRPKPKARKLSSNASGRGQAKPSAEKPQGVARLRPDADFEMQVRSRGVAGVAHPGNLLAPRHFIALRDEVALVVRVHGDDVAIVADKDQVPVTALLAREEHDSILRSPDRRPLRACQIDTVVAVPLPLAEAGDQHPRRGPGQRLAMRGGIEGPSSGAGDRGRRVAPRPCRECLFDRRGRNGKLVLGAGDEERSARRQLGWVLERILAEHDLCRNAVRPGDPPQRLARAHVVHRAGLPQGLVFGTDRLVRAGAETEDRRQSRTSPGSSQPFSSSTSSRRVRSRCSGVTEMSRRSNTALQSLPGTFSCACSSPPIQ